MPSCPDYANVVFSLINTLSYFKALVLLTCILAVTILHYCHPLLHNLSSKKSPFAKAKRICEYTKGRKGKFQ